MTPIEWLDTTKQIHCQPFTDTFLYLKLKMKHIKWSWANSLSLCPNFSAWLVGHSLYLTCYLREKLKSLSPITYRQNNVILISYYKSTILQKGGGKSQVIALRLNTLHASNLLHLLWHIHKKCHFWLLFK